MPSQRISAGRLNAAWRTELEQLAAAHAIEGIWQKQPRLWKSDEAHARVISNRLGWLDSLESMRAAVPEIERFAQQARAAGLRDVVLLGMGGSSLAPEVFSLVFPSKGTGRFIVLDSTDPASILSVERGVSLRDALFIVASKSGKTIETLSQFQYFHGKLTATAGDKAGQNFVAITDSGSHLEKLAGEHKFRRAFINPSDIGGRYSALSYFGLVPAALWGVNIAAVMDSALAMRALCAPGAVATENPALALGALMGAAALHNHDKMFLLATPALASLGNWIEQLVAESTGKEGKGIVPIAGEIPGPPELFDEGAIVVIVGLAGEDRGPIYDLLKPLAQRGVPVCEIRLDSREELGGEFFKWELATAVAGATLQINPFDEPNVQESKDNTGRILEAFQSSGKMPGAAPRLSGDGVELYAEGRVRNRVSSGTAAEALRTFFADRAKDDYLALLAYVDRSPENVRALESIRLKLRDALRMPVLLGFGPRFLHSIGQLYKGGPASGMFLQITAADAEDAAIPGAPYSFGQLKTAQSLGDLEALVRRDKPALRLHLCEPAPDGLAKLQSLIQAAVAPVHK